MRIAQKFELFLEKFRREDGSKGSKQHLVAQSGDLLGNG